jgi:hypothetical protein
LYAKRGRKNQKWSEEDTQYLQKQWPYKGTSELARILRRTIPSIKAKGQQLGLPHKKHRYRTPGIGVEWHKPENLEEVKENTTNPLAFILKTQAKLKANEGEGK